jgi:hypothetical protein
VVTGEAQFEAAAERRAVDGSNPGLAGGFQPPVELRQLAALLKQFGDRSGLALRLRQIGEGTAQAFEEGEIDVITAPLIAASEAIFSTIAPSSVMVTTSIRFIERPGMSQVTSAMPSPSTSSLN